MWDWLEGALSTLGDIGSSIAEIPGDISDWASQMFMDTETGQVFSAQDLFGSDIGDTAAHYVDVPSSVADTISQIPSATEVPYATDLADIFSGGPQGGLGLTTQGGVPDWAEEFGREINQPSIGDIFAGGPQGGLDQTYSSPDVGGTDWSWLNQGAPEEQVDLGTRGTSPSLSDRLRGEYGPNPSTSGIGDWLAQAGMAGLKGLLGGASSLLKNLGGGAGTGANRIGEALAGRGGVSATTGYPGGLGGGMGMPGVPGGAAAQTYGAGGGGGGGGGITGQIPGAAAGGYPTLGALGQVAGAGELGGAAPSVAGVTPAEAYRPTMANLAPAQTEGVPGIPGSNPLGLPTRPSPVGFTPLYVPFTGYAGQGEQNPLMAQRPSGMMSLAQFLTRQG